MIYYRYLGIAGIMPHQFIISNNKEIIDWIKENIEQSNYRFVDGTGIVQFLHEEDAVAMKLKWT